MLERTELIIGKEGVSRLEKSRVLLFGIGGVGGGAAEALVRSGIGALTVVDMDKVEKTNLNRQLISFCDNIGLDKTEAAKRHLLAINPKLDYTGIKHFYLPDDTGGIDFRGYDYVIDAVDTVSAKLQIVTESKAAMVPVISSMGTGNKLHPEMFEICDIYKTSVCPLAKVMRRELKARGIDSLKVAFSKEEPVKTESGNIGSMSFVPPAVGMMIAGEVIRDLAGIIR